jgi:hypothetical protein
MKPNRYNSRQTVPISWVVLFCCRLRVRRWLPINWSRDVIGQVIQQPIQGSATGKNLSPVVFMPGTTEQPLAFQQLTSDRGDLIG